ncbi:MAG TPA: hypothetical protein VKB24_05270, partial [Candidatus Acidoferrum sp.]|nr:hypothetical protein [Candidatus Acidoferrum sp.]
MNRKPLGAGRSRVEAGLLEPEILCAPEQTVGLLVSSIGLEVKSMVSGTLLSAIGITVWTAVLVT